MPGGIIILHKCTKNYDQMMYCSWDLVRDGWMGGRMDRWKKWHVALGAPPKNSDEEQYVYSGYEIAFDGKGDSSFDNDCARSVIIFGVDNSSLSLAYNLKKSFLI